MIASRKINNHLIKKIFKTILGFGIFSLLFFGINNDNTYAQMGPPTLQERETNSKTTVENTLDKSLQETKALLDIVLKIIYMISWPLLVIAGNAMDNSLIYGSIFHLDAPLWKFWNIMKNFANYALGFVLLFNILKSLFSVKGIDKELVIGMVKKILIAGILIQASWFLLSAVIDISTIVTYAIGGMPLTILKNSDLGDQKILGVNSTMNLSDSKNSSTNIIEDTVIYRTYGSDPELKIADCKIGSGGNSRYIIGKKINFIASGSSSEGSIPLEKGICILGGIPYKFNEFPELNGAPTNTEYEKIIEENMTKEDSLSGFEKCGFVIPIFGQLKYDKENCKYTGDNGLQIDKATLLTTGNFGYEGGSGRINSIAGTTLSTLIDKSKGFVGPLITIYSSTLNFGQLIDTDSGGASLSFGILLKFLIKTLIGIMLILPVLALAIIMLARIGVLWIVIAFTPILIIDKVFDYKIFEKMEFLKMENIIKLIFAPVLIVFGLSIALIFMSTLSNILSQNKTDFSNSGIMSQKESTLQGWGITQDKEDCYTVLGTWTFCTKLNIGGGLDNISYLLINIFGIAIMRSLLFWTIKQTGSIGEGIGNKIQKTGQDFAGNIPIVPLPGGKSTGINQIAGIGSSEGIFKKVTDNIVTGMKAENENRLANVEAFKGLGYQTKEEKERERNKNKGTDNTTQTNNPQITDQQINKIVTEATAGKAIDEAKLRDLIGEETTNQMKGSLTNRIKEPENVKLLFAEFEKQNKDKLKTNEELTKSFEKSLNINLLDIKTIKDYKEKIPTKEITTIISDLNANKLEALVTVALDTDIELTTGGVKKKYKISKKSDGKYESQEVVPPIT